MKLDNPKNISGYARIYAKKKGFTLIELLVTIGIIGILAGIMFPVFSKARDKAREVACTSNLRQIGMATQMYRSDYGGLPLRLSALYPSYVSDSRIFICPNDPLEGKHDGDDYLEGNLYLPSGVSYCYIPNWKYAHVLGWWNPPPHYGEGKWGDLTPLAICHWHWASCYIKDLDIPSWGMSPKGWALIMPVEGSVHRIRVEEPINEFSPDKY